MFSMLNWGLWCIPYCKLLSADSLSVRAEMPLLSLILTWSWHYFDCLRNRLSVRAKMPIFSVILTSNGNYCDCLLFKLKNSSVATYFTNRALCYLKLKLWESVIQDCRRALDLDKTSVKAHFFQGEAMLELHQYDDAIPLLRRG